MGEPGSGTHEQGPTVFGVDPRRPSRRLWHQGRMPALLSGATTFLTAATTLVLAGGAIYLGSTVEARTDYVAVAIMTLAAIGAGIVTGFAWRDWRSKQPCRIALDDEAVTLDLPAGRSPIHRPARLRERIPYGEIDGIETRLESYGEVTQRAYRLTRRDGSAILLFEDRAIGTPLETKSLMPVAHEIAEAASLHVADMPMVRGKPGVVMPWSTNAPDWSDGREPERREPWWRHRLVWIAAGLVLVAAVFTAWLILRPHG